MVLKLIISTSISASPFENDVNRYGTQTPDCFPCFLNAFENDVNRYGTQTGSGVVASEFMFENDVNRYGTQTR